MRFAMRRWARLLMLLPLLAACTPVRPASSAPPTPIATPAAVPTKTPFPTPTLTPTPTPTPNPPSLSLTAPRWLGRGQIVGAYFMPDSTRIAIGWANGVSLVDVATAAERWWRPTDAPVVAIDVHPEGQAVAAALANGSIFLFDAATGVARRVAEAEPHIYHGDVAWSPDGERLAFQFVGPHRRDPIYVLDLRRGTRHTVPGSQIAEGMFPALIWTPNGRGITLTDFGEKCTAVLDVETGERLFTLHVDSRCHFPFAMAWSPDGRRFALTTEEGVVLVDPHSDKITRTLAGPVLGLTLSRGGFSRFGDPLLFNADGTLLASKGGIADLGSGGSFDNMFPLVVWSVETGESVAQLGEVGNAYELGLVNRDRLAIAFDGDALLSLYENGELTRWAFASSPEEEVIGRIPVIAARSPLVWSADGRRVAAPNRYGGVAVWDVETGALVARFDAPLENPALSPDGRRIALTDREAQRLVVYDLDSGQIVQTLPDATSCPLATAFSPDGAQIAYGAGNRVIVADVATGERVAVLAGYPEGQVITRVIWSPDGEALVAASGDPMTDVAGPLILWERRQDGAFEAVFRTRTVRADYEEEPLALFSPSGKRVALEDLPRAEAGQLKTLVYDRDAGRVILTLPEYELAAWVSDEVLLTAEAQGWTRLTRWNVRTGEKVVGRGRELGGNVYAPGGRFYAEPISPGRGVKVRHWATGKVVAKGYHRSDVLRIAWSPDGHWLASLGVDGTLKVWSIAH